MWELRRDRGVNEGMGWVLERCGSRRVVRKSRIVRGLRGLWALKDEGVVKWWALEVIPCIITSTGNIVMLRK